MIVYVKIESLSRYSNNKMILTATERQMVARQQLLVNQCILKIFGMDETNA